MFKALLSMTVSDLIWIFPKLTNSISQKLEKEIVYWTDQSNSLIIIASFWETAVYSTSFYFVISSEIQSCY